MPIEAIVQNRQLPCVYTCCWRSDCVCSAKPPTLHFNLSLFTSIFPAIHFIHPPTPFIPHLSLQLAYINLPFSEQTLILYLSNMDDNDDAQ